MSNDRLEEIKKIIDCIDDKSNVPKSAWAPDMEWLIAEVEMLRRANAVYLDAYSEEKIKELEAENAQMKQNKIDMERDYKRLLASRDKRLAASEKARKEFKIKEIKIIQTGPYSPTELWINGEKI